MTPVSGTTDNYDVRHVLPVDLPRNEGTISFDPEFDITDRWWFDTTLTDHIVHMAAMMGLVLAKISEVDMFRYFPAIRFVKQCPEPNRFIHRIAVDSFRERDPALILFCLIA